MFQIFEVSAAPHLPYAFRSSNVSSQSVAELSPSEEAAIAHEMLADGIVLASAAN